MPARVLILFLLLSLGIFDGAAQEMSEPPAPPQAPEREVIEVNPQEEGEPLTRADRDGVRFRRLGGPVIFSDFVLKTNESVGDLVVIGGNAEIAGIVEGSLVVVGGTVRISGVVEGETVVVLGGVEVTDGARLLRETLLIGGPFQIDEGAQLEREGVVIELGDVAAKVDWFKKWVLQGLLLGRLLPLGMTWPWAVAAIFALVYLGLLLIFPGAVTSTVLALEKRPVTSIAVGMLVLILFAPLLFLLVISVAGILVIPFLQIGFLLLALFGKVAVICFLGRGVGKSGGLEFLQKLLPAFVVGIILLTISYMVPVIGILAWAVTSVFGLGGAVVALSSSFQREETAPPAPVRLSTAAAMGPARSYPEASGSTEAGSRPGSEAGLLMQGDTMLLPRAGFWIRFLASMLDWILLSLLVPVAGPLIVLVAVVYFVAMWTWRGTTVGSLVFGLKVVCTNGEPVNLMIALVRSLASVFSGLVLFLGFFWAGWDREKQSWHDKIAGTVVVEMPKGFALVQQR